MSKMTRKNKLLVATMLASCLLQMPFMALNPLIDYIHKNVFTDRSYMEIQTAVSLLNPFVMLFALFGAFIVARRWLSKKAVTVLGLTLFGATGIAALVMHGSFWNLWLYSVLIGSGSGFFISTLTSILFDNLSEKELRLAMGMQSSAVNIGGIAFGALGGLLAVYVWYGGYLLELIGLPIALMALFTIPSKKLPARPAPDVRREKTRLPLEVFYFAGVIFFFFLLYFSCGLNIAAHLANNGYPDPAIAGAASSIQVAGGVVSGLFFSKLSRKLKDYMMPLSFLLLFVGFTILNVGQSVLFLDFFAVFLAGMTLSIIFPYCIFSASRYVGEANSTTAASVVQAVAPGFGGFVSPLILTNLTAAFYPDMMQMNLRYQLLGYIALGFGVLVVFLNRLRASRASSLKVPEKA